VPSRMTMMFHVRMTVNASDGFHPIRAETYSISPVKCAVTALIGAERLLPEIDALPRASVSWPRLMGIER